MTIPTPETNIKISSQDTNDSLVFTIMSVLTPDFTKKSISVLRNLIKGVAEVFKVNINQINEQYNDSFILSAEGDKLDEVITDVSNIRRKNGESDIDYRNRYYKMIFSYDGTKRGIREAIYDITGEYPIQLLESNKRTAYWGQHDLEEEDQVEGTAYYYTDTFENTPFWGEDSSIAGFIGYIYLASVPTGEQLNELIDVLNQIKAVGVKIYLVINDSSSESLDAPILLNISDINEGSFRANFVYDNSMDYYIISLFDEDGNIVNGYDSIIVYEGNFQFEGLIDGVPYCYKLYSVKNNVKSPITTSEEIIINLPPVFIHNFNTLEDISGDNDWIPNYTNTSEDVIYEHDFTSNINDNTGNDNNWSEFNDYSSTLIFEHNFNDLNDETVNNNDWIAVNNPLPVPTALTATNLTGSSFKANWSINITESEFIYNNLKFNLYITDNLNNVIYQTQDFKYDRVNQTFYKEITSSNILIIEGDTYKYYINVQLNDEYSANSNIIHIFDYDLIMPSSKSAALLWNKESMIGSGTNINDLANNNDGTLSNSTSWVSDSKWGYGLNMRLANTFISHNNNYKSSGSNAKFAILYVFNINQALQINSARLIYNTQLASTSEINIFVHTNNSGQIKLTVGMGEPNQGSYPDFLAYETAYFTPPSIGEDFGIAFYIDLSTNNIKFILNQSELSISTATGWSGFYSNITDFKNAGGLVNFGRNVELNANAQQVGVSFEATLWRMMIAKDSNTPTPAEIKQIFSQIGLT